MKLLWHCLLWLCCGQALAAPALWSATRDHQQLWLFGSIHLGDQRMAPLPPALTQALKQSRLLLMEVDPAQISMPQLVPLLTLGGNETWNDRLGRGLAAELRRTASAHGLGQLERLAPWFATLQLSQAKTRALGYTPELGIDGQIHRMAEQQGLPVRGLEPPSLVFELMSRLNEAGLEDDFVRHSLDEMAEMDTHLNELVNAWQNGDEQALQALLSQQQNPELSAFIEQQLLDRRNRLWLEQLTTMDAPEVLVVVGALHLYGERGLIAGLTEHGFTLKKMPPDTLY